MNRHDGIVINAVPGGGWQYRIWDGRTRKYRSKTFHRTDEDAQRRRDGTASGDRWSDEQGSLFALGQDSASLLTMAALGAMYLEHRTAQGDSQSYLNAIGNAVKIAVAGGITELSKTSVAARLQNLLAKHKACRVGQKNPTPATPRTKNAQIAIYKAMSAWAIRRRLIGKDPFLGLEKVKEVKEHREVYTIAELREMVAAHRWDDEFFSFVMLAVMTGARSETLRSLTWGMIDRENNRIKIPGAILKANMPGQVPLQPDLLTWLDAIGNGFPSATILPKALANISSDRANEMMQAYLIRCGIGPRGRSVHCIRHSVAGLLTATEMSAFSVMDALCHRNVATSKHYAALADNYREQLRREKWPVGQIRLCNITSKISVGEK